MRSWVASEGITLTAEHVAAHPVRERAADSVRAGLAAWLPALPLLLLALFLLVLPTLTLILGSVGLPGRLTLEHWVDTFQSNGGRQAILTSIRLGLVCGLLSMLIGGPLAWFVSRMVTGSRSMWLALLNVAANFGGIGLAFGYMAALGTYGMVTLGLQELGIPWVPPEIGSFASLVMAYLYTNIPLFVLLTLPAMAIVRQDWFEAAEVCRASRWQFWRYIGLPVLSPFLLAGFLLIFTWSIGIYGLAFALGGSAAATGRLRLITLQIGISLNSGVGTEERSFVLATVLLILAAAALLTYRRVMKRALRWFS